MDEAGELYLLSKQNGGIYRFASLCSEALAGLPTADPAAPLTDPDPQDFAQGPDDGSSEAFPVIGLIILAVVAILAIGLLILVFVFLSRGLRESPEQSELLGDAGEPLSEGSFFHSSEIDNASIKIEKEKRLISLTGPTLPAGRLELDLKEISGCRVPLNGNVVFDTADEAASVVADHDIPEDKLLRILSPIGDQPLGHHDTRRLDLLLSTVGGQPKNFQINVYFRVGNNRPHDIPITTLCGTSCVVSKPWRITDTRFTTY